MKASQQAFQIRKLGFRGANYKAVILVAFMLILSCAKQDVSPPATVPKNPVFLSYTTSGQTLPTSIDETNKQIKLEVKHSAKVANLLPQFETTPGFDVYVNGVRQVSGSSAIDLSNPVTYELRDSQGQTSIQWNVSAVPLGCTIVIDASHDGGVWWYPQTSSRANPDLPHQGNTFASILESKGFIVTELGGNKELTEEMFFGSYIVIRVNGFEPYTANEIKVYDNLIKRGTNLVFFTDHKQNDPEDEIGKLLGIEFKGSASGQVTSFAPHEITANMVSLNYLVGSVLTNANSNPNIQILGSLRQQDFGDLNFNGIQDANEPSAPPVMGILTYPKSKIFFIGDTNALQVQQQPFINNLIHWMGNCVLE